MVLAITLSPAYELEVKISLCLNWKEPEVCCQKKHKNTHITKQSSSEEIIAVGLETYSASRNFWLFSHQYVVINNIHWGFLGEMFGGCSISMFKLASEIPVIRNFERKLACSSSSALLILLFRFCHFLFHYAALFLLIFLANPHYNPPFVFIMILVNPFYT